MLSAGPVRCRALRLATLDGLSCLEIARVAGPRVSSSGCTRWVAQHCLNSMAVRESSSGTDAATMLTGVVTGFGGNGWPSVRLSPETVRLSSSHGRLVLAEPSLPCKKTLLMRGQRVELELVSSPSSERQSGDEGKAHWKAVAVLAEAASRKKCIHPTRVAALCLNCPRRKASKIFARTR